MDGEDPKEVMRREALAYHEEISRGKYEVVPTKKMEDINDLSLAYSPGVAFPCLEIAENPQTSFILTNRANSVGIFTNGTACMSLGDIGVHAAKPAMEGVVVLMKQLGDVDALDVGVDTKDPEEFVNWVKLLEPSFGAFNLQDIKAPECFYIEERLQEHMDVPVMHNNQHSTACVITATLINACDVSKKDMKNIQVVVCGAGASGYSIARLLPEFGIPKENIVSVDSTGVIYDGRWAGMNKYKERIAIDTKKRTLKDVVKGSDVFIGVSTKDLLTPLMLQSMNENPIVFAMSTPEPEINVDLAKSTRADVIIATGRSDYPNQILDTMVFPFFFRGALDVGAKTFNLEMKKAVIESLVRVARMEVPDHVKGAYGRPDMVYGRDYLIPTAFDHRLLVEVSYAVARAAHDSGNSTKPYDNWDNYKKALQERVDEKVKEIKAKVDKAKERFDSVLKFIRSNTVDIK